MIRECGRRVKRLLTGVFEQVGGPLLAPVIGYMARTGAGTDACLERGYLPMRVHYYSPVPDLEDLKRRRVWDGRSELVGLEFPVAEQLALLSELGREFGYECDWPSSPSGDPCRFHTGTTNFGYGCAAVTHCMLRQLRPQRVVEVGSGNSSLVIAEALRMDAWDEPGVLADYSIVDPYPGPVAEGGLSGVARLVDRRVEVLDVGFFERLGKDDVLFIDSGHTVRIGGDVNYLVLEVLPRLAPGVVVHFHDIGLPYEYPEAYATNPPFRVFWTEAYLLQAFLCYNPAFRVLVAMRYIMANHLEAFRDAFPHYDPAKHPGASGSFWIRRGLPSPAPGAEGGCTCESW